MEIADNGPIKIGDYISWHLFPARCDDVRWLSRIVGADAAARVTQVPQGNGEFLSKATQGIVSAIDLIWDLLPSDAAHDQPSGGLAMVSEATLTKDIDDRRAIGYLIALRNSS